MPRILTTLPLNCIGIVRVAGLPQRMHTEGNGTTARFRVNGNTTFGIATSVREFLKDRNAAAAYVRAGYKDTPAAAHNASRLMGNDKVRAAIAAGAEKVAECTAPDVAYVLRRGLYGSAWLESAKHPKNWVQCHRTK
jgi:hypothetical protein